VRPQVLVKGGDYRREDVVGHDLVEAAGGETILVDLVPGHSTTALVRRSATPKPPGGMPPGGLPQDRKPEAAKRPPVKTKKPALLGPKSKI
jgi:hypothetical protein